MTLLGTQLTLNAPLVAMIEPVLFAATLTGLRVLGVMLALPGTALAGFPTPSRMLVITFLTVMVYSANGMPIVPFPQQFLSAVVMILSELVIGFGLGFIVSMVLMVADATGAIAGMGVSLSMAGMVDPASGQQSTAISNLLVLGTMMMFVVFGGHHEVIRGLISNFDNYPVGESRLLGFTPDDLARLFNGLFFAAIRISAPMLIITALINVGLGLMARAAPQMNIFAVGFSVLLIAGLFVFDSTFVGLRAHTETEVQSLQESISSGVYPLEVEP